MGASSIFRINDHKPPLSNKKERGQAVVEAAIAVPILLVFLALIIDLGRMVYARVILTNAARESAYFLSYHPDAGDGAATGVAAAEAQNSGIAFTGLTASSSNCCTLDQPVTVTVSASVNGFFLSGSVVMSNPVTMLVQR
jgi:Flp pilus assembly protein TadG